MELVIREAQSLIRGQRYRVVEGDTCFYCRKQGHWARDCPYKSPDRKPTSLDSSDFPVIQCRCGAGTCLIRISNTPRNPGRKFCSCPAKMVNPSFLGWVFVFFVVILIIGNVFRVRNAISLSGVT